MSAHVFPSFVKSAPPYPSYIEQSIKKIHTL